MLGEQTLVAGIHIDLPRQRDAGIRPTRRAQANGSAGKMGMWSNVGKTAFGCLIIADVIGIFGEEWRGVKIEHDRLHARSDVTHPSDPLGSRSATGRHVEKQVCLGPSRSFLRSEEHTS